jgi:uncharacterized membrane protein
MKFLLKVFLVLPPKYLDCPKIDPNVTNTTVATTVSQKSTTVRTVIESLRNTSSKNSSGNVQKVVDSRIKKIEPEYNYSREYGRSVLTDVRRN